MVKDIKKTKNTCKDYENEVAKAIRELYPDYKIETDKRLPSAITGRQRQVDILLHHPMGLVDYDAKDHRRNIGIDTVADFAYKLKDEQVPKGVIVSRGPYAATALLAAKDLRVKATHLIDTADPENPFKPASQVLAKAKGLKDVYLFVSTLENVTLPLDFTATTLQNEDGSVKAAYETFRDIWNNDKCPENEGRNVLKLKDVAVVVNGIAYGVKELIFIYDVETTYRKHTITIAEARGLYDAADHTFQIIGEMKVGPFLPDEIETWPALTEDEVTAGTFNMELHIKSTIPKKMTRK